MGDVIGLPKRKRLKQGQADAFRQMILNYDLPDDVRVEIDNAIYRATEEPIEKPEERWPFVKISPEQWLSVMQAVRNTLCPDLTFRVWNVAVVRMRYDTGEVLASRTELASDAGTLPCHVSTAMTDLERIGAIIRRKRGKRVIYFVNPHVGWNGGECSRQAAVKEAPKLTLVADNAHPSNRKDPAL